MDEQHLAFLIFVAAATGSPGGATTLATASGMRYGLRRSLPYVAGVAAGMGTMAVASALGLAALLMAVPALELSVRVLGTAYLLFLAWRVATGGSPSDAGPASRPIGLWGAAGLVWYNPKAWAVTIGASSSFAHLAADPAGQAALIGGTFLVFAAGSMLLWCSTGHALGRLLRSERQWRLLNAVLGLLLAASVIPMWTG
ncbi:LysE family translocator [Oceanibacterium hippocampi]|uniref:Cysteine/O-acetylserine efflux protein n=1 Tax=Oceanibacterium hippocampi TaxID=745714 RepID=A0A1Y5SS73_9PROT|nr:LysE family transporter [Oceanibacterium hippocampi]SLN47031.1 Cysteine/O-acetylserine efflux protein [Oceanibacterium hippocampi]